MVLCLCNLHVRLCSNQCPLSSSTYHTYMYYTLQEGLYQAFTLISVIYVLTVFLQPDILVVSMDTVSGIPMLPEEFHTTTFTVPALTVLLPKWLNKVVALETLHDLLNSNFCTGTIRDSVAYKLLAGDVNSKYHLQ